MRVARRLLAGLALLAAATLTAAVALAWHQGYRAYIVHTGSMVPTLRPGEAVVDQPVRGSMHRGEIITFRYAYGPDQVVTHRVFSDAGGAIRTKGDANPTKDPWTLRRAQVVGTPAAIVPDGGYVLVYLSQPTGAASVATFALMIWLLWDLCFRTGTAEPGRARPARARHAASRAGPRRPRSGTPGRVLSPAAARGRRAGGRAAGRGPRSPRPAVR